MKKFFYIIVFLSSFTTASAQTPEQVQSFVISRFPTYMADYVLTHVDTVVVTKKYAKKQKKKVYQYTDLGTMGYQGHIRIGDTLMVFNKEPFYSKGQKLFIVPLVKKEKQRVQRVQSRTTNTPRNPTYDGYGTSVIF